MFRVVLGSLLAMASVGAQANGMHFSCKEAQQEEFRVELSRYFGELGVKPEWVSFTSTPGELQAGLAAPYSAISTLELFRQPELDIREEIVMLPGDKRGASKAVQTVSQKEIALALLHPGRKTEAPCDVTEFREHVGIRQNIVAWAERLSWGWPDGGPAKWNKRLWRNGTPLNDTAKAIHDAFVRQADYAIGCYTATKMVVAQGVLDYYKRIRPNQEKLKKVLSRLEADKDPLVDIEPPAMWAFEDDFDPSEMNKPGKLLQLTYRVQPGNFVPGDWSYMLNTDPVTYQKTGYEGSNAIYLGRDKFDDYYNDHSHSYTYREKLNEVYQWRNGVFNRGRDAAKAQPLTERQLRQLELPPEQGGLVMAYRAVPYFYGELFAN